MKKRIVELLLSAATGVILIQSTFLIRGASANESNRKLVVLNTGRSSATVRRGTGAIPLGVTTYTVNSTLDSADTDTGDGVCSDPDGFCTMRAAIQQANASAGTNAIVFDIPAAGPHTITPGSALPTITGPVTMDGTTQPGFAGTPIIELNGSSVPPGTNGLLITAGSSTVRGLVINRFPGSGDAIEFQTNGGNTVEGNFIGTDLSGNVVLPNGGNGVFINGPPNNIVGGTAVASRNVISGNGRSGVLITGSGSTGNFVQGNFIGTNAAGAADLGNGISGVEVQVQAVATIGGTVPGARNVISGNNNHGISFGATSGNLVQGNLIGTDVSGTIDLGNSQMGVQVTTASANNTFGGTTPEARNIVSGNDIHGFQIRQTGTNGNLVQGNFIGTQIDGTSPLGNSGAGVLVEVLASNNSIGGTASGAGNVIAFNGDDGVTISSGTGNAVLSNSIFSNSGLGIDLSANGVTANDACDGDSGPNNLQNFPMISSIFRTGSNITINASLNSTAGTTFNVDYYSNISCDSSGNGEGRTHLGATTAMTDGTCNTSFSVTLTAAGGDIITATATDAAGNTSEFSQCFAVPTAAPATISGQITRADGLPLGGVLISLSGRDPLRRAITNAEGAYSFSNVDTDLFYSVSPLRANYLFSPRERSFTLVANKTDAVFTATPIVETANPLDTPEFFVRQNYLDFLGREPDQGGLDYWSHEIRGCNGDVDCLNTRRIGVSAAFFIEQEFQQTGSFVYRLYKASLGRQPNFAEFTLDRKKVTAGEESRAAFAHEWVTRLAFKQLYPESMTAAGFVNRLFDTASLQPYADERRQQIEAMRGGKTRAQVLRDVIETAELRTREYNPSFVLMEYFGYLCRDPDPEGYDFWLDALNNRERDNYRAMVCAFITSTEYQQRFSSVATRANRDCGQ
jgi:hypothetical protein